ncbi:PPR domain-containing protein/PPR_2 domain-containing protein [Cephalotus follicularis]|uniref:PPR domain-containing protein/PPR_2 domain-containing protein n=1 Tax=Cephalotus follicularis TaxID=3775 RepID=A0A1Q3BCI1_CEPFO|nr:PPR domain-containing protein/PPR_2 domain-containing protein [Cephalotus follicularis]
MVDIILTNAQSGISCFERNGLLTPIYSHASFCSRWRPIFGVALNAKNSNKKRRILGSKTSNCGNIIYALARNEIDSPLVGGGVLEKELQFIPSFDECLKAMESIKTRKEKEEVHKSSQYASKDGLSRKYVSKNLSSGRDGDTSKWNKFEGNLDKDTIVVKHNVMHRNNKFDRSERRFRDFRDELHVGEDRNMETRVRKKLGRETPDGRLSKYRTSGVEPGPEDLNVGKKMRAANAQVGSVGSDNFKNKSTISGKGKFGDDGSSSTFLKGKTKNFDRREVGFTSNEFRGRHVRNYIGSEDFSDKENAPKYEILSRSNKFLGKGKDNAFEVERAAFKTLTESKGVVDKPRVSKREMEERIQKLAMRLNGAAMPEWMFSKMIRSAKIKFTDHTILRVIQILGKLGNWRCVLQVIEWLQMRERFQSYKLRYIYTTALGVLGKARRPVEALNVFHAMQQRMSSYPDIVAYHCIAITLGQAGYLKELFDLIDSMLSPPKKFKAGAVGKWDPRLEPDIVIYNAVLNACAQRKKWEGAFWVLQQLKQQGQQPSTTTYGLVMEVMLACGKYNLVHEFFTKMQKSSIPNALSYKVLVNTLWREGKIDEAVLAVQDMERRGIVGSAALYYDLARCLCSAGRCQEALMQIDQICKVATKPLVVTYTGLIQACLDSGNIQNGVYIFNRMNEFCAPNLVTCNIVLKAYIEHGLFEKAKVLFQKMLEDGKHITSESDYKVRVIPDIFTFNTMLDACAEEKRWSDLEYVYEKLLHHGYHFNSKRHLRMILNASRAGKEELLETTWKHLAQADRIPPPSLIKERFCVKLEKGDHLSAISCIIGQPVSELQAFSKGSWLNLFEDNAQRFRTDSLTQIIHEVSILVVRSDLTITKPLLQNLIIACKEFIRTHETFDAINEPETVCTVQTALK